MNRSPAFQFYPDKWQSHTRRLSDSAYRVYHEMLCWMWQHSEDHCSVHATPEAVACATAMPLDAVRAALTEIQNPFSPLLKEEGGRLVSNGLRKEAEKQFCRRKKAKESALARWSDANASPDNANALPTHSERNANASVEQCFPSPSPTPTPSPIKHTHTPFAERPSLEEVKTAAQFIGLAPWKAEDWWNEMEGGGWLDYNHRPVANWRAVLNRVKAKWEAEGRPAAPPSGRLNGSAGKPNAAPRIGPSLAAVQEYARDKDDGTKRALAYSVGWWQAWEGRGWKRDGKSIDWQIEFAKAVQSHLQRAA